MVVYQEWIAEQLSGTTVPPYAGHTGNPPRGWVSYHCIWAATTQGHTVWRAIDDLWQDICAEHEVRFKRTKDVLW